MNQIDATSKMEKEEDRSFKELSEIFKALGFPVRVEILKILEKSPQRYSELMKMAKLDRFNDAGKFAYHLSKLMENGLVEYRTENKIYAITPLGKDVLNLAMTLFESLRRKENILLVRRTDSSIELFDRKRIEDCLVREAGMEQEAAEAISLEIEERLYSLGVRYLTAPLIREYVNAVLLEKKMENYRHRLTRLGIPVHDVNDLISLRRSIDDVVKDAGEEVMKQYTFLMKLPREIGDIHLGGVVNINHLSSFMFKPEEGIHSFVSLSLLKIHSYIPVVEQQSSFKIIANKLINELSNASSDANSLILDNESLKIDRDLIFSIALSHRKWNIVLRHDKENLLFELFSYIEELADKTVLSNFLISLVKYNEDILEEISNKLVKYLNAGGALLLSNSQKTFPIHHLLMLRNDAEDCVRSGLLGSISLNLPLIFEKASLDEDAFIGNVEEIVHKTVDAFRLQRESLKSLIESRRIPLLSGSVNGESYFIVEKGVSMVELTGLYEVSEKICGSQNISDVVSEAEKVFKKINEAITRVSEKNNKIITSLISHEEAERRFRKEWISKEKRVNLVPKNLPFEEWFKLESKLKSLVQESNLVRLQNLDEFKNLKKANKSSILIHNPATMCACCGRVYPVTEEGCVCGSRSRSFY
ncbi:MAG: ArsR family transcriptional regulator [Candidatus Hadarchaeum sp.]|uniref:anaerobic ribonucleoside-triphosphate reductase n=1 Tax=Candidatus Hadarchaeum sp. TaxID=2883567 RepID=UPI00318130F9